MMNMMYRLLYSIVRNVIITPIQFVLSIFFITSSNRNNNNNHISYDGLAPAVTAKAAQVCINYLQSLVVDDNDDNNNNISRDEMITKIGSIWLPLGFQALKQEAYRTKSLILLYIHSPIHSDTKEYCRTVLNSNILLNFLFEQQSTILAAAYSIYTAQGYHLQSLLHITTFPAIIVLQPNVSQTTTTTTSTSNASLSSQQPLQILIKAQGKKQCQLASIMPYLHAICIRHTTIIHEIETRRLQRIQEQELRQQQDMEYQQTLAADQERERQMEIERMAVIEAETKQLEAIRTIQEQKKNALQHAKNLLRPEPDSTAISAGTTTMIRFILPSGTKINRRFYVDETIESLRAYLYIYFVEQQSNNTTNSTNIDDDENTSIITNIGLSTNLPPRQTFNNMEMDNNKTLQETNLIPQAVLMVQDLDA